MGRKWGGYMEKGNYFFGGEEEERRKGRMNDFGERKYIFCRGEQNEEGKGGKYLKKDSISFWWKRKIEKVKSSNCYPIYHLHKHLRDEGPVKNSESLTNP